MRRRSYRHGAGGRRQKTLLDHPFNYIADPRDLANASGLGGKFGLPELLWVPPDGKAPTRWLGEANTDDRLTQAGTLDPGVNPYQLIDESALPSTVFDVGAGSSFVDATASIHDPALTDDAVAFCFGSQSGKTPVSSRMLATRVGGQGWQIFVAATTMACAWSDAGGVISRTVSVLTGSVFLVVMVVDRDDDMTLFANSISSGGIAVPGGASAGSGLGIGGSPSGGTLFDGQLYACGYWYGPSIADDWLTDSAAMVHEFTHLFTGIYPRRGSRGVYTRASVASWKNRNGIWHLASQGLPRAGDSEGLLLEPQRQNDVYNVLNAQVTTGWSVDGGTHTAAVDDSSALDAADLGAWGPDVHRFVPGGSDQVIYGGTQNGNANAHCITVAIRGAAGGESVDLGLRDVSAGTVQNLQTIVCTTSYQLITVENQTPADTDMQWCLDCDAGDTVYFVAAQLEEGAVPSTIAPNSATGGALIRPQDVLDLSETPSDTQGSIELTVTPQDWGGTDAGTPTILTRATGSPAQLYVGAGGTWCADLDGTTTLNSTVAPVDGVAQTIRLRWVGSRMSIDVNGTRVTETYNYAIDGSGVWRLAADAPVRVRNLRTYQSGGG
jgi:hypothetical protein